MKKSVVLVEVIFSIVLFAIIATYSLNILVVLFDKSKTTSFQLKTNLELESTRLFLVKNNDFSKLKYDNSVLRYNNHILLNNITKFNLSINNKIATINICIENNICQKWKILSDS